jgi:hypothetical protein
VLGDAGQHARADLFAVVEREDEVRPVGMWIRDVARLSRILLARAPRCFIGREWHADVMRDVIDEVDFSVPPFVRAADAAIASVPG